MSGAQELDLNEIKPVSIITTTHANAAIRFFKNPLSRLPMKLTQNFNQLTFAEYLQVLERHRDYSNFNVLGLFRSILENSKLELAQQLEIRKIAISKFAKQFEFLQLKDPQTYIEIQALVRSDLTIADKHQMWRDLISNQQKILTTKKLGHRNFGVYSKHSCGVEYCYYNGMMIKRGSFLMEGSIRFDTDEHTCRKQFKVDRQQKANREFRNNLAKLDLTE